MTPPPYQLTIDGFANDHFRVHSFTGREAFSEAWQFDLVVTAPDGDDVDRGALAQRATLIFNLADKQRAFYGIVAAVRLTGVHAVDHSVKYHVRVVPRLWLMRKKKRTRIFQKMRVTDIVTSVLQEAGIVTRWQLTRAYPEREYTTQYEETDYQFVRRLLADAGIYFYFFGGGPVDAAALVADEAVGAAAAVGSSIAGMVGGSAIGGLVGAAAGMAETLIPGDTVVGADDASCYPPVGGDDAGALAASTAAALAPAVGDVIADALGGGGSGGPLGGAGGVASFAVGAASAVAGTVIADLTGGARSVPVLHFMGNEAANVTLHDKVTEFSLRNTVRSSGAMFRDYDPDRPMVRLQSTAVSSAPFPPSPLEIAAEAAAAAESAVSVASSLVPGAAGALGAVSGAIATADSVVNEVGAALGAKVPFEVYEHHGPFLFPKWAFANDEAPRILRQKRRRASIAKGEGGMSDFSPGHRFTLQDHPAPQLDATYVVVSVEHWGETQPQGSGVWKVYSNHFECAPAEMTYPPPRPKRKSVQVALTATVVGPDGQEIWVDEKGQIKVQFHWDREGKYDENSSCWIRVMQPWGGAGWGHQFIPRIGMEVVITFEGGDPDKPLVLGSLYNGTHPPPFKLPQDRTKSGIRTRSTPGGVGYNELSFEDASGHELVALRAQRDLTEAVLHDRHATIGGTSTAKIGDKSTVEVHGDASLEVGGRRLVRVTGAAAISVGGDSVSSCGGNRENVVAKDDMTRVLGGHTVMATKFSHTLIGHGADEGYGLVYVNGDYRIAAANELQLLATKGLKLTCGESTIEIGPDGVTISAPTVKLKGGAVSCAAGDNTLQMGKNVEIKADQIELFSKNASLVMDEDAKIDGRLVKLNCGKKPPPSAKDENAPDETGTITFHVDSHLASDDGVPLTLVIATPDGKMVEKPADSEGKVTLTGKKGDHYVLVDVRKGNQSLSRKPS